MLTITDAVISLHKQNKLGMMLQGTCTSGSMQEDTEVTE